MIPDNVTLIVKAPNQQIEDQNIECQSSWTVKQLKGHLSEVYPSNPSADEQKIIYSGQLLDDNAILKDVLRTYETQLTQFTHTMHLVCTPKRRAQDLTTPAESVTDGLRHRNVEVPSANIEAAPRPEMRQNDQNHTAETIQQYLQSGHLATPDAASMHHHVLMMQRAYLQYMQQYAQMWQAGGNVAPGGQPMNVVNEVPQPQPPAEAAAPAEEPEEARRDWLDHVYAASRLIVLVSLVHLYSSLYRFLLVLVLCVAAYLHQIGFFRELGGGNIPAEDVPQRDAPQANANAAPNANANANPEANVNPANTDNAAPTLAPTAPNDDHQQSLLAVTWMIFSSFFASLIPEINQ